MAVVAKIEKKSPSKITRTIARKVFRVSMGAGMTDEREAKGITAARKRSPSRESERRTIDATKGRKK